MTEARGEAVHVCARILLKYTLNVDEENKVGADLVILEKGMGTYSSILAWRIPWTIYSPWGCKESDTVDRLSLSLSANFLVKVR